MKTAIKLWLSGQEAERERHYSANKGILFFKGEAVAVRYHSNVTHKHHIIVNDEDRIPVNRMAYSVPDIFSFIHISRMHTGSFMNDEALHRIGIPPSNLSSQMLDIPTKFDSSLVSALRLSNYRYFVVTEHPIDESLGINSTLIKDRNRYFPDGSFMVYGMNDPVDFTLATVSGSLFHFDRETAIPQYLERLSLKSAFQRKLSTPV